MVTSTWTRYCFLAAKYTSQTLRAKPPEAVPTEGLVVIRYATWPGSCALFLSDCCQEACLAGYAASARLREAAWKSLLWIQLLQRVLYEMRHRPAWTSIPLLALGPLLKRCPNSPTASPLP